MTYVRVLPRDLFNEAKLLKCIGRLTLLIHDQKEIMNISFDYDGDAFIIGMLPEGAMTIWNIHFTIGKKKVLFKTTYNSRSNFPLFCEYGEGLEVEVFDDAGNYTKEFRDFCKQF